MVYTLASPDAFQSTLPARGSDYLGHANAKITLISIHAPRKGERRCSRPVLTSTSPFQSTLPARGSDKQPIVAEFTPLYFNPRSPQGGATASIYRSLPHRKISIHAPRKGERQGHPSRLGRKTRFQSTLPARGSDHYGKRLFSCCALFQSTLPARGSDKSSPK